MSYSIDVTPTATPSDRTSRAPGMSVIPSAWRIGSTALVKPEQPQTGGDEDDGGHADALPARARLRDRPGLGRGFVGEHLKKPFHVERSSIASAEGRPMVCPVHRDSDCKASISIDL
jgi:hypothetical protein